MSQSELFLCVLQYGKKKLKYLPYNHQHEYFFLSEYPLSSLPFSWNATCPFQPSLCEQNNSSNPNSSHPSSGPCAGPKISSGISKHLEHCPVEQRNVKHLRLAMTSMWDAPWKYCMFPVPWKQSLMSHTFPPLWWPNHFPLPCSLPTSAHPCVFPNPNHLDHDQAQVLGGEWNIPSILMGSGWKLEQRGRPGGRQELPSVPNITSKDTLSKMGKVIPGVFSVPQDLAWAISYYLRYFITYIPFYGVLGSLCLLTFVR